MKCPGSNTRVPNTRPEALAYTECPECGLRVAAVETEDDPAKRRISWHVKPDWREDKSATVEDAR